MNGWKNGWKNGWMDGGMDGCMDRDGWMDIQIDVPMYGWIDGQTEWNIVCTCTYMNMYYTLSILRRDN